MRVTLHDTTLRDGQHAVGHQMSHADVVTYARAAEVAGLDVLEVGHGNGLGASSLHIGRAALGDLEMLQAARAQLVRTRLAAFVAPGWATRADMRTAAAAGVDVMRVASHCTEADTVAPYVAAAVDLGVEAQGVLLMSHMAPPDEVARQCAILADAGAAAVGFLDSAGTLLPDDVVDRVQAISAACPGVGVVFHAHDNLGLATWNSVAAARAGATVLDACARGLGAGAGNASLEQLVATLDRVGIATGVGLAAAVELGRVAADGPARGRGRVDPVSVASGTAGVFSGFKTPVLREARRWGVSPVDVFAELGRRGAVAGQEDLIEVVAMQLATGGAGHDEPAQAGAGVARATRGAP